MNYKGRIVALLIVTISSSGLICYNYYVNEYIDIVYMIVSAVYLLLGWSIGKHYDRIKFYSERDFLTGDYNRRFALHIFPKLKKLADEKSDKIIVFFIDIDNFKSINDQFGHEIGDRVLQHISSTLFKSFHPYDYVIRWGGDEFIVLLPGADQSEVITLRDNLQAELSMPPSTQQVDSILASSGYSIYPDEGVELIELIKLADKNMYSEKRSKT